jgi:hypothetical protein
MVLTSSARWDNFMGVAESRYDLLEERGGERGKKNEKSYRNSATPFYESE